MTELRLEKAKDYLEKREVELIVLDPEDLRSGLLFVSQDKRTFNSEKLTQAHVYSEGKSTRHTKYPNIFPFSYDGRECFLVGNGHHRVAEALLNGRQIPCEKDNNFGEIDASIINDPVAARIKFAVYGIEGIWPFSDFLEGFTQVLDNNGQLK